MQFLPCSRFCQYSSRFLACGNCPAMPITAIAAEKEEEEEEAAAEYEDDDDDEAEEDETATPALDLNCHLDRLRLELSFFPPSSVVIFVATLLGDKARFAQPFTLPPTAAVPCLNCTPCLAASSCT